MMFLNRFWFLFFAISIFFHPIKSMRSKSFEVAPMMAHTNRHFRYFFRLISTQSILYSEMVMSDEICLEKNNQKRLDILLGYNSVEYPFILQLGGNDPKTLSEAVRIANSRGITNINLNCGCPSSIVSNTNGMGASLMKNSMLTSECCLAIHNELSKVNFSCIDSDLSLSVKCRIGVDDLDNYDDLYRFIDIVSSTGRVKRFQIHARKAILSINPIQNRDVPPINYDFVYRLVNDFPHLEFVINGCINSYGQILDHFRISDKLKGVMVGRAIINHPYMWINVDTLLNQLNNNVSPAMNNQQVLSRGQILEKYCAYCESFDREIALKNKYYSYTSTMLAPMYNLFAGEESCNLFRRRLKKFSSKVSSASKIIEAVMSEMDSSSLNGRVGEYSDFDSIQVHERIKKTSGPMQSVII